MRRLPGQVEQLSVDWGATGVTIGVRVLDNEGATTIARTTGFVEYPAGSGVYYLDEFTFPDERGSYTLLYDDDGGTAAVGHVATEDLEITSSLGEPFDGDTYATTDELFRILKIRTPTADQTAAGERVLIAATGEINAFIDLEDDVVLSGWQVALAEEVCLERAVEHWRQQEAPFGLLGLGVETGVAFASKDSWGRHAEKLAPLKAQWGFA